MATAGAATARRRSVGLALCALLVVALHGTLAWIEVRPEPRVPFGDELRYWEAARTIASSEAWRPDPVWPVLYSLLLGGVVRLGGGETTVALLQSVCLLVAALLWADLARRFTGSALAGALAGALLLVDPQTASFTHYLWPEVVHLALFIAALWCLARAPMRSRTLFAAGLLLGLALLTKKLLWPFLPVLVVPVLLEPGAFAARLRRLSVIAAGLLAVLAPATAIYGPAAVSPVSSAVFNLWVGLNDRGRTSFSESIVAEEFERYERSAPDAAGRDRLAVENVERRLTERGPAALLGAQLGRQYFRLFDKDSFLTEQLPGGDIHRRGSGYRDPPAAVAALLRTWSYLLYGAALLGAVIGMVVLPPRGRAWLWTLLAFVALNVALFLFLHVKSRYRVQFLPVVYLYAGAAVAWIVDRCGPRVLDLAGWRREIGWRPALVGLAAVVGLSIWFWGV